MFEEIQKTTLLQRTAAALQRTGDALEKTGNTKGMSSVALQRSGGAL